MVTALAALRWQRHLDETHLEVIDAVKSGVVTNAAYAGKCSTGGRVNGYRTLLYNPKAPYLAISQTEIFLSVPPTTNVNIHVSSNLINWTAFQTNVTGDSFPHYLASVGTNAHTFYKIASQ